MRKSADKGYVTDATPRKSGFRRMLETNRHSGKLSGRGSDRGIGHNADVLLGLWSCCRNVDPGMQGCITAPNHTRTLLKCRQCGSFYNHLDNTGAKLRGAPNCRYHRKEPVPAKSHGNAVWPCCGTVGYEVCHARCAVRPVAAANPRCAVVV